MLTVKEAFQAAQDCGPALRPLRAEAPPAGEVELSADERYWNITLGWVEPAIRERAFAAAISSDPRVLPRVYKTLVVDVESGAVRSMTIREIA